VESLLQGELGVIDFSQSDDTGIRGFGFKNCVLGVRSVIVQRDGVRRLFGGFFSDGA